MKSVMVAAVVGAFLLGALVVGAAGAALDRLQPARSPRCYDAAIRFPESVNPRAALIEALRATGRNPNNPGDLFSAWYLRNTAALNLMTAQWIAESLWEEREGRRASSLVAYLTVALRERNYMEAAQSPVPSWAWEQMHGWSADSCEGSFIQNPQNAGILARLRPLVRIEAPPERR